ncbi:hypothetical protein [Mesorhizobium sp. CO1-1-8]|uniref:hypothetical protein n=1 Tax=Mesorhizobium sp. CO1-1-8 TaxID=2876631 RepID=UPI001CD14640|nr:hypothetical protein [Mesorhizobium sp. CO1-1-8]MBZ9777285.1 hypothetical protein [Mesorhizobium sp. CO1-1-8]
MPTLSRLFDSRAEAAKAAGDLVSAGIARVRIAVIGPYRDELAGFGIAPTAILAAVFSGSALMAFLMDPHGAGFSPTALAGLACASIAGGLIGSMTAAALKQDEADPVEGIVLVTAHVPCLLSLRPHAWLKRHDPATGLIPAPAFPGPGSLVQFCIG